MQDYYIFNFLLFLFTFLTFLYVWKISYFLWGLFRLRAGRNKKMYHVTVIVPARNEEENISRCLRALTRQKYPSDKLEIVVVDDFSTDRTADLVRTYTQRYDYISLINPGRLAPGMSPKKRALQTGIESSSGEIIITTDADCWASPQWIRRIVSQFEEQVGVVTGLVLFDAGDEKTIFHKIQAIEFLGLTMAGIGSIGAGDPIIANGANFAFRRRAFQQVNGYEDETHIISGDDDLLLQKIVRQTDWKVKSVIASDSFVYTRPLSTIVSFLNQRIRWASKGLVYKKFSLVFFLASVYLFYLLLFISIPLTLPYVSNYPYPVAAFTMKLIIDFLLILKGTAVAGRRDLLKYFLIAEIFQIPYIIYVGFTGILGQFNWKGR
ncbi:MAG: glycosyltransferase [Candidatus Zhuqueibacterota bacterium]